MNWIIGFEHLWLMHLASGFEKDYCFIWETINDYIESLSNSLIEELSYSCTEGHESFLTRPGNITVS